MNLRRATQIGLGLLVLVIAVLSMVASTTIIPEVGVMPDNPGGLVWHVDPGSPAWRGGIREGQEVTAIRGSDSSDGWELWTTEGQVAIGTSARDHIEVMRSHIPWALVSLFVAGIAALLAYR
ncbi:MAG: PDZ domain-containing protein, partial [Chloroflexota bacterium]